MGAKGYVRGESMPRLGGSGSRFFLATLLVALLAIGATASSAFALSPSVATQPASGLTETGANLNALVNPNGLETKMYFEYGPTTSYGTKTSEVSVGSGSTTLEKSQTIGSLTKNSTYHYRVVASNSSGTSFGSDVAFTTVGAPEGLTIGPETFANGEEAILRAFIDPNGQATTYQFEMNTGVKVPASPESAGSGYNAVLVTAKVTGLTPGTEYSYAVTATNASGKFGGNTISFFSNNVPNVSYYPVSGVWRSKATVGALVNTHELATTYYVEYGTTTSYGSKTAAKEIPAGSASVAVSELLSGLKENSEYHYRLVATNSAGTTNGKDQTLTTLASVTLYTTGGTELKKAAALKAFSNSVEIAGRPCSESEFSGELEEQPGARQRVTAIKMQSGATGCTWKPESSLTVKYRAGTQFKETLGLEFAKKGSEVLLRTSPEYHVAADVYLGAGKVAECEYNFTLSGTAKTGETLSPILAGKTEYIKGSLAWCPPGNENVAGIFAITSEGKALQAK